MAGRRRWCAPPSVETATSRFGTVVQRNGILIAAAEGTSARAVHEGRVAFADPFAGFGNLVILEHGEGDYSIYGHLRSVGVKRGDTVQRLAVARRDGRLAIRNGRALFRASRRRQGRGPLTMVEETLKVLNVE